LTAAPDEREGDFRVRAQQALRERRGAELDELRQRYAPRLAQVQEQLRRARERVQRESGQYEQQKLQAIVSVGAAVLGAVFGRRSARSMGGVAAAARGIGRAAQERRDVGVVEDSVDAVVERQAALEAELAAGLDQISQRLAPEGVSIESVQVPPRKSDLAVEKITLAWAPWWLQTDGTSQPAYTRSATHPTST
jgi:hypothetical protein